MERANWKINLQIFAEGGAAGAGGGESAGGGSAAGMPTAGQIMEDGTQVDHRLAERIAQQRKRHPGRASMGTAAQAAVDMGSNVGAQGNQGIQEAPAQDAKTPEQEFDELIKGKYRDQYQQRFQQGINDRFKNQADLQGQLDSLKPMLDALAKQRGIEAGDYEALSRNILDDDSLYEEEAEEAGMTVEAYKTFQQMKAESDAAKERLAQEEMERGIQNHLRNLAQQGEELRKVFPDFDLRTELANPAFRRMTSPDVGLTVEQAYYAVHHAEMAPQAMAAGIQRAQKQISQSIMANRARPVEGAMQGNPAAADIHVSPRNMTREERQALKDRAMRKETIVL